MNPHMELQPGKPVTFLYKNWRGEVTKRRVIPEALHYGATEWHPEPQWLLRAFCLDRQEPRDFSLEEIDPYTFQALDEPT